MFLLTSLLGVVSIYGLVLLVVAFFLFLSSGLFSSSTVSRTFGVDGIASLSYSFNYYFLVSIEILGRSLADSLFDSLAAGLEVSLVSFFFGSAFFLSALESSISSTFGASNALGSTGPELLDTINFYLNR